MLNVEKISFKGTDAVIYNIKYITMKSFYNANVDSENYESNQELINSVIKKVHRTSGWN